MWIGLKTLSQHFRVLMLSKKLLLLLILLLYLLHNSTTAKMDLKQKYPRTSSFNQLKNQLNIQQACLLSNEREELCNGNDTFLKQFFSFCTIIIKLLKFPSIGEPHDCEGS